MAQFATWQDLQARLVGAPAFTTAQQTQADTLLILSSGLIQREARQVVELVTNDVLTIPGTPDDCVRLPERPVVGVTSITLNGVALTAGDGTFGTYYLAADRIVRPCGWGWPDEPLVITYDHGYNPVPDAIRAVTLEPVVRVWVNPGNVMHEQYGSSRQIYAMQQPPTGLMLNTDEIRVVHDVLRRTANTVPLR